MRSWIAPSYASRPNEDALHDPGVNRPARHTTYVGPYLGVDRYLGLIERSSTRAESAMHRTDLDLEACMPLTAIRVASFIRTVFPVLGLAATAALPTAV